MQEIEVIRQTRAFLQRQGLFGKPILDLYTDAHPALIADRGLEPFQRFRVQFDAFAVHPDLVGRLADGQTMFAVEAKGKDDWLKGIAQADTYRQGFHAVALATAGIPSPDMRLFARQRGLGIIAVQPSRVDLIEAPILHLPRFEYAEAVRRQFSAGTTLRTQFYYNLPTHYLACAIALAEWEQQHGAISVEVALFEPFVRSCYPAMPRDFKPALRGAEKLGLLLIQGQHLRLSALGRTCAALLPTATEMNRLHQEAKQRPLAQLNPHVAAVLRILLFNEPIAGFINQTLAQIGPQQVIPMPALVETAARLDKVLAPSIFFFPHTAAELIDDQGFIVWRKVLPEHYRTSIYMQYKQIMMHAGIIADHGIGATSSKRYQPERDRWELLL